MNPTAPKHEAVSKLMSLAAVTPSGEVSEDGEPGKVSSPDVDDDEEDEEPDTSDETDDLMKPGESEKKRRRKLRLAKIRRKTKARAYEFTGGSDIVGMVFLEVSRITDLPPERNSKRWPYARPCTWQKANLGSDENVFRYGSLRRGFFRQKDISNTVYQPQPEPSL